MKLKDSLESQGSYLFKNRGYFPLLFVLFSIPVSYFNSFEYLSRCDGLRTALLILVLCFIFTGHFIRSHVVLSRKKSTSGRNRDTQVADHLNTEGWYSLVRNPLYVANFLIWFGFSMYLFSLWLCLILILAFWIYYERIIYAEEEYLYKKFGTQYDEWCQETPIMFPKLHGYKAAGLRFSFKKIILNEYPSFLSTYTCFLFVFFLRDYCEFGRMEFNPVVLISMVVMVLFGLLARFFKYRMST